MTSKTLIILTSAIMTLSSCGPNEEQKAAKEKVKMDSITKATEKATTLKIETKIAIQDSIKNITYEIKNINSDIANMSAELVVAKDKIGQLKEWKFGRSASEREEQIRNQTLEIIETEKQISILEQNLKAREQNLKNYQSEITKYQ